MQPETKSFMLQFGLAAAEVEKLRKLFPGCFNADGTPRVASVHFDRASETDDNKQEPRS